MLWTTSSSACMPSRWTFEASSGLLKPTNQAPSPNRRTSRTSTFNRVVTKRMISCPLLTCGWNMIRKHKSSKSRFSCFMPPRCKSDTVRSPGHEASSSENSSACCVVVATEPPAPPRNFSSFSAAPLPSWANLVIVEGVLPVSETECRSTNSSFAPPDLEAALKAVFGAQQQLHVSRLVLLGPPHAEQNVYLAGACSSRENAPWWAAAGSCLESPSSKACVRPPCCTSAPESPSSSPSAQAGSCEPM
mmetsp:Transcript_35359/g.114490  ORF Transcript_35359/g.114490 Transcript_35359/m.114490 type:complete len:247 (-) Transcript_35359:1703-2443(-)